MNLNHEMVFHLPNNFDLGKDLPNRSLSSKHNDKYQAVISLVVEAAVTRSDLSNDAFYFFRGDALAGLLTTRHYKLILEDLKAAGIIECDEQYIRGQKCKGYRLSPKFRSAPTVVAGIKDEMIARKLEKVRKDDYGRGFTDSGLDRFLLDNFKRLRLSPVKPKSNLAEEAFFGGEAVFNDRSNLIHLEKAFAIMSNGLGIGNNPTFPSKKCEIIRYRILLWLLLICGYNGYSGGMLNVSRCTFLTYTNNTIPYDFTSKSVKVGSSSQYQQLLDVQTKVGGSSQYLSSIESNWENRNLFITRSQKTGRIYSSLTNLPKRMRNRLGIDTDEQLVMLDIRNSQPFLFNVLLKEYYQSCNMPADVEEYIRLTSQGQLYDTLMVAFGVADRDRFKKEFFGSVFYCDTTSYMTDNARMFEEMFPNVFKVIQHHKKKDFRRLAWDLQKAESNLLIDRICGRLYSEGLPDLFVATIHDSVLVNAKYQGLAERIIMEEFGKKGLAPTLNVDLVN